MLGHYFLLLFIGECALFLLVLAYAVIADAADERSTRREAELDEAGERAFAVYQVASEDVGPETISEAA